MNNNYRIALLLSLLMPVAFGSCTDTQATNDKAAPAKMATPALEVAMLTRADFASSIQMPGELVAYQQVDLYAKVSSFVKRMNVDVGSQVRTGQLLATLEAPEMSSQLAASRSKIQAQEAVYFASKATYDRLLQTSKTPGTISQNDLDQANARQKADMAQLDAAKAAQQEIVNTNNYLEIRAPFDGVITARNVSAGAYVGPSGKGSELPVFTLQEQQKLRLVVSVPDAYVSYINTQSEAVFTVRSYSGHKFTAHVNRLAGALDNKLRSQRIEMDVENKEKKLLPGMIAEVNIPLNSQANTFSVPATAILNSTEGVYVIKIADKKAIWVPVTTGRTNGSKTEVFGTLDEKDMVVVKASEEIRNGSAVGDTKVAQ